MAPALEPSTPATWSVITETSVNLEKLRLLCSHEKALRREGYVTKALSTDALLSKLRCKNCASRMKPPRPLFIPDREGTSNEQPRRRTRREVCEFHPGRVVNLHFTCCQAHVSIQKGCQINLAHVAPDDYIDVLETNWAFHSTPAHSSERQALRAPDGGRRGRARFVNTTAAAKRSAVAMDCEFGISVLGETELIRVTAIDFFTKEVLIDNLVKPSVYIKNYNTRYSGVTSTEMRDAVRNRTCIYGRDAAREKLLQFVDINTIIIVHGGSSDMSSLRWLHPKIIDTHILETYFEPVLGGRSLKNLCKLKFNLEIQKGRGHDSLEDSLACRELAIWVMNLIPDA